MRVGAFLDVMDMPRVEKRVVWSELPALEVVVVVVVAVVVHDDVVAVNGSHGRLVGVVVVVNDVVRSQFLRLVNAGETAGSDRCLDGFCLGLVAIVDGFSDAHPHVEERALD